MNSNIKDHLQAMCHTFRLLTVFPFPDLYTEKDYSKEKKIGIGAYSVLVGFTLGLVLYAFVYFIEHVVSIQAFTLPLAIAIMVFALLGALTRLMHVDAIADVSDAFWGGFTIERRLEIMSDSSTGSFGTTAIVLYMALFTSLYALHIEAGNGAIIIFTLAVARFTIFFGSWLGKPAKKDGMGRGNIHTPRLSEFVLTGIFLLLTVIVYFLLMPMAVTLSTVLAAIVAIAFMPCIPFLLSKRFGGMTGDVFGACTILGELSVLFIFLFVI